MIWFSSCALSNVVISGKIVLSSHSHIYLITCMCFFFFHFPVDTYTNIFGYMQMMGIIACPIIGLVMDYKIKEVIQKTKQHRKDSIYRKTSVANGIPRNASSSSTNALIANGDTTNKSRHSSTTSTDSIDADGSKPPMGLRIRKLRNSSYAFGINAVLIVAFGVFALIPILPVQVKEKRKKPSLVNPS